MGGWRPTPSSRPAPSRSATPTSPPSARSTSSPRSSRAWPDQRAEVDAIAADPAPPTFENTLVALERSGDVLRRVSAVFFVLASSCQHRGHPGGRGRGGAAAGRARRRDPARPGAVRPHRGGRDRRTPRRSGSTPEARAAGRALPPRRRPGRRPRSTTAEQERLRAINAELSSLTTEFGNRLLAEADGRRRARRPTPAELDGLAPDARSAAARAAARPRSRRPPRSPSCCPPGSPALAALTDRELRERLHDGVGHPRPRRRARHPRDPRSRSSRSAPSGPACSATRTTRRGSSRPRPRATVEAVDAMLAAARPVAAANARAEADDARRPPPGHPIAPVGLGLLHRAGAPRALRRRHRRPAPVLRAGARAARRRLLRRASGSTASGSPSATTCPAYHPDVRVFEVADDDGAASACSSPTSTPATPSAAAPG